MHQSLRVASVIMAFSGLALSSALAHDAASGSNASASTASAGAPTPNATMLRFPDVSATHICFVYANDVWLVPRSGGVAVPLSSPPGQEQFPRFSPDGKRIAFNASYEGNREVYTMPVSGGTPTRVTHHPGGETICDWTPDGNEVVFISNAFAGLSRQSQLFRVDADGGLPEQLPVPYGGFGAISPDGQWLAYTPHSTDNRTWKRYRGGMATDIWLFNLKTKQSKRVTDWEGTDTLPMWSPDGKTLYYLADAGPEHRLNIWAHNIASGENTQISRFTSDDIRWPSIGPGESGPGGSSKGEIVFQLGSKLMLWDLTTNSSREVEVSISGDAPFVRPRLVNAAENISGASLSPSGKRVAVEARGDLWSAPANEGVVRPLTRTNGVAERDPAWSPDGRWIAYFSDESGEYDLYVRPSDARPPEKKKSDSAGKPGDTDAGDKEADAPADDRDSKPRKLASLGEGFRYSPSWSPDSKWIVFTDKANCAFLVNAESGEVKQIDCTPFDGMGTPVWSHDSAWLAYVRTDEDTQNGCIWFYNVASGEKTRVTSPAFNAASPAFDRKGDVFYYVSKQSFTAPRYSDIDATYIYADSDVLLMTPLRSDVKSPMLPKSDEEELKKKDEAKDKKAKDEAKAGGEAKSSTKKDEKKDDSKAPDAASDDGISGSWEGSAQGGGDGFPPEGLSIILIVKRDAEGKLSGAVMSAQGVATITAGTFNKDTGELTLSAFLGQIAIELKGKVQGNEVSGTWSVGDDAGGSWSARRKTTGGGQAVGEDADKDGAKDNDAKGAKKDDKKDEKKPDPIKIDLDGFEARGVMLPLPPGNFGGLAVNNDNKLIFTRIRTRGEGGQPSIKLFDPADDAKEEKLVAAGVAGFQMSADGKKLLVSRGGGFQVLDAAAGGGKATTVPTAGMTKLLEPREEWRQIFREAWRLNRDFFYEPTLHGVDWKAIGKHYEAMIDDCASREDLNYVIAEMISELNIGHAYLTSPGDVESAPGSSNVGLLGCEFKLVTEGGASAYQITRIYTGGPWDADARGPLSQPGVDAKVGDFLIAVNGVPVDTSKDPWAAFLNTAGRATTITLAPKADGTGSRDVLVRPIASEGNLRYRAWIEEKRAHVHAKSKGRIGYVYVPNTGIDGQNDLYRQFFGQRGHDALIIDERWNGGGQIPTRFIELLNRPSINYWARRDGQDWVWPPDGHNGPKAMLVNGLAGSGGDAFPWYFRYHNLGKIIGTRTWGGLVGISGNPRFVDGGAISVPTFGFYEKDGTWGVEGHGVDPDLVVLDDPAKMQEGGDPQLDAAIDHLLNELKTKAYQSPTRPKSPNRRGMGIPDAEK
ncbi:MAG: PDZ domain-containing protein [Planctomycetota bacterium]|nr:PDZ domain-containing protein [Planctomycetota bacterium]